MGTVALRVAKSPLNYYQQIKMARLSYVNGYLHQLNEQFSAKPGYHKESLINEAGRQLRKLNKVYPRQVFYIPIADIGLFLTYAYTCRRLVTVDPELATGGLFWFKDLTLTDQTFLLPCMAAAISYASIEYSLIMSDMASRGAANHTAGNAALQPGDYNWELSAKLHTQMREEQDFQLKLNTYMAIMRMKVTYHMSRLQEYSQMAIILTFPIVASFPAGVFMYWIPNGLMQLGQIHALYHPAVKSFINERVDFKRVKLPEGLISTAELQNMQMREKRRYESENIDEVMATHQEKMRQRTLKDKERIQKLQHAREERENRDYAAEEMVKDAEVVEGKKDSDTAGSSNRKPLFYQDARSCPAQTRAQVSYKQSRRGKGGQKSSKSRANKTSRK